MQLSVFTSDDPLSKTYRLGEGGLEKLPGGKLARGFVERKTFLGLDDFARFVSGLNGVNALAYGVPKYPHARVLAGKLAGTEKGGDLPIILRTRSNFSWPQGEGVFMLDHDVHKGGETITPEQLLKALHSTCPELATAPTMLMHSASSHIYEGDKCVVGQGGMRIYIRVKDVSDVQRAGKALFKRLWLSGYGHIEIGKSGVQYEKTLIDKSVWDPERLDFAGGACCEPPYHQKRPAPVVLNEDFDADAFDTRLIEDLTDEEEEIYLSLVAKAKGATKKEAEKKKQDWLESLPEESRASVEYAMEHGTLPADFVLTSVNGEEFTIRQALANKEKYHGIYVQHPFEPDYQPDNEKLAQLKLDSNPKPCVHTFAHGGQNFWIDTAEVAFADVPQPTGEEDDGILPKQKEKPKFTRLNRNQILALPDMEWIVKGVLPAHGISSITGQSTAGKSFLAFDMACHIGYGEAWFGRRVKPRQVVYVCLEGEAGFKHRVEAWEMHHGRPIPAGLDLIKDPFRIMDHDHVTALAAEIPEGAVVIVDTLNRSAPDAEENTSKDMGLIIAGCAELERRTKGPVVLVSHEGKDSSKSIRGHSSLFAALDGVLTVKNNGDQREWTISKCKDGQSGITYACELRVVDIRKDCDGDMITSCVIIPTDKPTKSRQKLNDTEQLGLDTFHAAWADDVLHVEIEDWRKEFYKVHTGATRDSKCKAFDRARKGLVKKKYLRVDDTYYYLLNLEDIESTDGNQENENDY